MRNMKGKIITFTVWFLFLGSFGFAGGGLFLLFAVVPFEEMLVQKGYTQSQIDNVLKYVVFGWVAFGFLVSLLFYQFIWKRKKKMALIVTAVSVMAAISVLYVFMKTDSVLIAMSRGEMQQTSERFTFGPYPEEELLRQLKEEGYNGVITLLSPTLPFENQLLQKELELGKKVGLPIHSFPMLPWVGDNTESINGIKELVESGEGRFYIHCYLGKHRVDMVKQVIKRVTGQELEQRSSIFPSDFQRGPVYLFREGQITLGPYPTKEEWSILIRNSVKEVISYIDPNSSRGMELNEIAKTNNLTLTFVSKENETNMDSLLQMATYLNEADHKVYVMDFRSNSVIRDLETVLRKGYEPINHMNDSQGETYEVGSWIVVGSETQDWDELKEIGIETVVYVSAESNLATESIRASNLNVRSYLITNVDDYSSIYQLAYELEQEKGPFYVYAEHKELAKVIYQVLDGMYYGIDENETFPPSVTVVEYDLLMGPPLTENEWKNFILKYGIRDVIFLHAPSIHSEELVLLHEQMAKQYGVSFSTVPMFEDYRENVYTELKRQKGTTYIIVPNELKDELYRVLTDY